MSSDQQIKGDSLRRQLEMSRAYAKENNLELDDRLRDIGVSARKGDNRKKGAFLRLAITEGKLDSLGNELSILEARNHESADVIARVQEARKEWHSLPEHEQYDARLRLHMALRAFIDFMSFNSETEVVRVVIANGLKAYEFRRGAFLDRFPFGYGRKAAKEYFTNRHKRLHWPWSQYAVASLKGFRLGQAPFASR